MTDWTPMTDAYTAANGLVVEPVGSDDEMRELGETLRNGLMDSRARAQWAGLCEAGDRQILRVRDAGGRIVANAELEVANGGRIVANAELEVANGVVEAMFVRGDQSRTGWDRAREAEGLAVAEYLEAVNARRIPLKVEIVDGGFDNLPAASPWEEALRLSKSQAISPFMALVTGLPTVPEATINREARAIDDLRWAVLTGRFVADNGWSVEPLGSRAALRDVGVQLENMLFYAHGEIARLCAAGVAQFAAVRAPGGRVLACAELRAADGRLVTMACRGRHDSAAPAEADGALGDYVAAVNDGRLATTAAVGAFAFATEGAPEPGLEGAAEGLSHASILAPTVPTVAFGDDEDDYGDEDADFLRDWGTPGGDAAPERWEPLTDRFAAPNGLFVEPVCEREELRAMGEHFRNALATMSGRWARLCAEGVSQVVRVVDAQGTLVSNAELHAFDGRVEPEFNRGMWNGAPGAEADEALAAYCAAVNDRDIPLRGEVGADGFSFQQAPSPGV